MSAETPFSTTEQTGPVRPPAAPLPLRPPEQVTRLARMGAAFQTRLSFMRILVRRMHREGWRIERTRFAVDDRGYGHAVYCVQTPERRYSLVAFSHALDPDERTDRVIAEAWDTTFALFDGEPSDEDIERLAQNVPKQEAGRYRCSELVLSRANKSVRLFEHVVERLSQGMQPDPDMIQSVGYLMRTTAVYGNGKFGICDRLRYRDRGEICGPFQAEMLTVYLIRLFTLDLVEHVAQARSPSSAVPLAASVKRYLGIGNATGLGMAPFLWNHPVLIHQWFLARETAFARLRGIESVTEEELDRLRGLLERARRHVHEWSVADHRQAARIQRLHADIDTIIAWVDSDVWSHARPLDALCGRAEAALSLEGQELLLSVLLEVYPELVADLEDTLTADTDGDIEPAMCVGELRRLIDVHYHWALETNLDAGEADHYFWYVSEEKLEPRLGVRAEEPGAEKELPFAVAREVRLLADVLGALPETMTVAQLLVEHPELRLIVRRVQTVARYPYGELRDNLVGAECLPIDILRWKLAYFGASKFDPKSDRWTRITLYQGAPLPEDLGNADADDWCFPTFPERMQ